MNYKPELELDLTDTTPNDFLLTREEQVALSIFSGMVASGGPMVTHYDDKYIKESFELAKKFLEFSKNK
jgi:hypothetical protein